MTLREKLLYHHVHPAKLTTDVTAVIIAAALLWQQHLLRAIAVGLGAPALASLLVLWFADLEKLKRSHAGRTYADVMTPARQAITFVGVFVFWGAAWYRSIFYCSIGLLVMTFAWWRGILKRSNVR